MASAKTETVKLEGMNIFQRMSAITQEISTVAKNLTVGENKNQYKAVGEADVLAAVKPIEAKYGVYSFPFDRDIVDSGEIVNTTKYGERKSMFMRIRTVYRFTNIDKPEEYIDIVTYGDGVDTQDKAPGKAMTYGDKYALLKAYKIQTGDDPDQNASEPLDSVQRNRNNYGASANRPSIDRMVEDIKAYMAVSKTATSYINSMMEKTNSRTLSELAFQNEALITACWGKWCSK